MFKIVWGKLVAISHIELAVEFHPVKTERVKECGQSLHQQKYGHRHHGKGTKHRPQEDAPDIGHVKSQTEAEQHAPQYLR